MHIEGATHNIIVSSATSSLECLVTGPTPADVTVSGRVLDKFGRGISRATVTLTDGSGAVRTTSTNSLGHFSFADVESGTSIVLEASARGYTFSPKVVRVEDDTSVDIVAN